MQTFGDLLLLLSILAALWIVPRYLWRVYHMSERVKTFLSSLRAGTEAVATDQTDRQTDRHSVSADDLHCPRLQLDRSKTAVIEVMVYNDWSTGEIRSILKGDNGAIGLEVEAARQRLGVEAPNNRTPIAQRPTDAEFVSR